MQTIFDHLQSVYIKGWSTLGQSVQPSRCQPQRTTTQTAGRCVFMCTRLILVLGHRLLRKCLTIIQLVALTLTGVNASGDAGPACSRSPVGYPVTFAPIPS